MQPKNFIPFVLVLGMTAGSTAVYAEVPGVDSVTSATADITGSVTEDQAATTTTTTTNSTTCVGGDSACAGVDANASAGATMTPDSTEAQSDMAAGTDVTLPGSTEGSATMTGSADVAAGEAPAQNESTMPMGTSSDVATSADVTTDGEQLVQVAAVAETDELVGARAYDSNNEWIGEVSAVIPADDQGNEERFVIDVGGFLGIGEKPVAIAASDLRVAIGNDGDVDHVVISHSMTELEAMPEVEM